MTVKNYKKVVLDAACIKEANDKTCVYSFTEHKSKTVFLYNQDFVLVRVLRLEDFGILDRWKKILRGGHEMEAPPTASRRFALSLKNELLCTWGQEGDLCLFDFDANRKFMRFDTFHSVFFDERNDFLWTVRGDAEGGATVLLLSYEGKELAALPLPGAVDKDGIEFAPLYNKEEMALTFSSGQTGGQTVFLRFGGSVLTFENTLPNHASFLFCVNHGKEVMARDTAGTALLRYSYPQLQELARFTCPKEGWQLGGILPYDDKTLLVSNDYDHRHYLFAIDAMEPGEELVAAADETAAAKEGLAAPAVSYLSLEAGRPVFRYSEMIEGERKSVRLIGEPLAAKKSKAAKKR